MARKIEVQIVGDADSLHRALGKAQDSTGRLGHALGAGLRVGAVAAGGAILGLGYALKRGIDDFNESQKAAAQTRAVLKSTGGAAGITAKQIQTMAGRLSNLTGIDDEAIQGSENLLLTFRNIKDFVGGQYTGTFDEATNAVLDMSTAMGTDLRSSSILVGKALNDPVKGMTALRRVGVTLSAQQEDLVKHLVATGKTTEAQKVILGELTKEFGGSAQAAAKTLSGQLNILKNAFDNAASAVIQQLLPYMVRLANFAFPLVVSAIQGVSHSIRNAIQWVAQIASHFQVLGGKSATAGDRIHTAWSAVVNFFRAHVMPIIQQLRGIFQDAMKAIAQTVQQHGDEIHRIAVRVGNALQAIAEVAMPLLRYALVKVLPKAIGLAITALDNISNAIETVVNWIETAINDIHSLGSAINSLPGLPFDVNKGLLDNLGVHIDPNKGLLNQAQIFGGGGGTRSSGNVVIPVHIDGREVFRAVVSQDKVFRRQNGRGALA